MASKRIKIAFETMRSLEVKRRASTYEEKLATLSNFNLRNLETQHGGNGRGKLLSATRAPSEIN